MCTKIIFLKDYMDKYYTGLITRQPFNMGLNKTKIHFSKLDRLFNILHSDGQGDAIVKSTLKYLQAYVQ